MKCEAMNRVIPIGHFNNLCKPMRKCQEFKDKEETDDSDYPNRHGCNLSKIEQRWVPGAQQTEYGQEK